MANCKHAADLVGNGLYREFQKTIYNLVLSRCQNHHDAEDITQEVFITAKNKFHQLKDQSMVGSWLKQIAVRHTINYMKLNKYKKTREKNWRPHVSHRGVEYDLEFFMERLEQEDNHLLVEYYWKQKTISELSKESGKPSGTIKRKLFVARNRLREIILGHGFDLEIFNKLSKIFNKCS